MPKSDTPQVANDRPVQILYVGAYGRSGSTLLGRILAEDPSSICVGETRYLWTRGLHDNARCGCGAPFHGCEFWTAVAELAFGGWDQVDAPRMANLDRKLNRIRMLPWLLGPACPPSVARASREYRDALQRLYGAIAAVSGARTIVEISKDPTFAALLAQLYGERVRVIHLVRDSRAVAYSWTRRKREPSPIAGRQFMPQFSPSETAVKWVAFDAGLRMLGMAGLTRLSLTYEDLTSDPSAALERIWDFALLDQQGLPAVQGGGVHLGDHHMFSANPMRTARGWVPICADDEWRARLSTRDFAAVTVLTFPQLHRYGYPLARTRLPAVPDRECRDRLARA